MQLQNSSYEVVKNVNIKQVIERLKFLLLITKVLIRSEVLIRFSDKIFLRHEQIPRSLLLWAIIINKEYYILRDTIFWEVFREGNIKRYFAKSYFYTAILKMVSHYLNQSCTRPIPSIVVKTRNCWLFIQL